MNAPPAQPITPARTRFEELPPLPPRVPVALELSSIAPSLIIDSVFVKPSPMVTTFEKLLRQALWSALE